MEREEPRSRRVPGPPDGLTSQIPQHCSLAPWSPRIVVDFFRVSSILRKHRKEHATEPTEFEFIYFLSHFHQDHYGGITNTWNHGPILCSPATARLLVEDLRVESRFVVPMEFERSHFVNVNAKTIPDVVLPEGTKIAKRDATHIVEVRLMDANHCPGAAGFLFLGTSSSLHTDSTESSKKRSFFQRPTAVPSPSTRRLTPWAIFHTGDFRFHPSDHPTWRGWHELWDVSAPRVPISALYLDSTYAHPKHTFPAQEETCATIAELVARRLEDDTKTGQRTLFVVATYTIGKERALKAVHDRTGLRVCVSRRKMRILQLLDLPYLGASADDEGILTTDPTVTPIHVVPWGLIGAMAPGGWKFCPDWGYLSQVLGSESKPRAQKELAGDREADIPSEDVSLRMTLAVDGEDRVEDEDEQVQQVMKKRARTGIDKQPGIKKSRTSSHSAQDPDNNSTALPPTEQNAESEPPSYTRLMALVPTGWTHDAAKHFSADRQYHMEHKYYGGTGPGSIPRLSVCQVPYSEHSSFAELREFMQFVRPAKIVPTVYAEDKGKKLTSDVERREKGMDKVRKWFADLLGPVDGGRSTDRSEATSEITAMKLQYSENTVDELIVDENEAQSTNDRDAPGLGAELSTGGQDEDVQLVICDDEQRPTIASHVEDTKTEMEEVVDLTLESDDERADEVVIYSKSSTAKSAQAPSGGRRSQSKAPQESANSVPSARGPITSKRVPGSVKGLDRQGSILAWLHKPST
ncbi:hypothetical protein M427DRAFT_68932 [Gonapodya prolifera JEL478]|uniref:DNA repair metallo-beta-lactamase domain-containing protein n=1 Tax=Gonapodya prolifera (strain JEL478) TaxID=1344416 RepID=A0A139AIK6_GONPJ|nr:hypothetical protein M427DRAFT_68932 [Gonapodya prolifera JEL478]|eukprot:KXS16620.1 hypothetical protein M427DRAFT_68932 [Gonapodya prolifera JEL478]